MWSKPSATPSQRSLLETSEQKQTNALLPVGSADFSDFNPSPEARPTTATPAGRSVGTNAPCPSCQASFAPACAARPASGTHVPHTIIRSQEKLPLGVRIPVTPALPTASTP